MDAYDIENNSQLWLLSSDIGNQAELIIYLDGFSFILVCNLVCNFYNFML